MGDPVTISLLVASIGTAVGGAVLKGKAATEQAEAIADAAEFNALRAEQAGNAESARVRRLNRRIRTRALPPEVQHAPACG